MSPSRTLHGWHTEIQWTTDHRMHMWWCHSRAHCPIVILCSKMKWIKQRHGHTVATLLFDCSLDEALRILHWAFSRFLLCKQKLCGGLIQTGITVLGFRSYNTFAYFGLVLLTWKDLSELLPGTLSHQGKHKALKQDRGAVFQPNNTFRELVFDVH